MYVEFVTAYGAGLRAGTAHGSLEGIGGLKTNEAYHSKADALVIPEMFFFLNLPTPFFEMLVL